MPTIVKGWIVMRGDKAAKMPMFCTTKREMEAWCKIIYGQSWRKNVQICRFVGKVQK